VVDCSRSLAFLALNFLLQRLVKATTSPNPGKDSRRMTLTYTRGAVRAEGAPNRSALSGKQNLEDELHRNLPNPGIGSRPECREVPIAKRRGVVHGTLIAQEVYLIEDIEELTAQLHLVAFSY